MDIYAETFKLAVFQNALGSRRRQLENISTGEREKESKSYKPKCLNLGLTFSKLLKLMGVV